jgi:hypothetical protein
MKVYISGPITGIDNYQENFAKVEGQLCAEGFEVVNPIKVCADMKNNNWCDYMKADIIALVGCDAIYAMRGWKESKGATIEINLAKSLGMMVVEE